MSDMLSQCRRQGFARVPLTAVETRALLTLFDESNRFFANSPERNSRYSNGRLTNGYRPPEAAHNNGDPINEADVNDSFLHWNPSTLVGIPHHEEIKPFITALEHYRALVARHVMHRLMVELTHYYDHPKVLPFEDASVLQVNSFNEPSDRELLQTRHEDGVLATVIWTSAPGLEAWIGGKVVPVTPGSDEVLVMPGGILAAMTGGDIPALYHQARNHGGASLGRKSIMYFSCPDIDKGPITPYIVNDRNRDIDIRELIRSATDMFGLATDFVTDH